MTLTTVSTTVLYCDVALSCIYMYVYKDQTHNAVVGSRRSVIRTQQTGSFTLGRLTFWISLSLRPKTETKPFNFGLSPEFK